MKVSEGDLIQEIKKITSPSTFYIWAFTDEYNAGLWDEEALKQINARIHYLLELRVFNESGEVKAVRSAIGKDFILRSIVNEAEPPKNSYDEVQFLDIDDSNKPSEDTVDNVVSTGGGRYRLPLGHTKNAKVRIRYYLGQYPDTGQARIIDWRLVCFMEGE